MLFEALKLRLDRGLSAKDVAHDVGITPVTLRKIEKHADHTPHPTSLKRLGDYYGVPASTLRRKVGEATYLQPGDVVPDGVMAFVVKDRPTRDDRPE